jgi:serine/threonine protein kinase
VDNVDLPQDRDLIGRLIANRYLIESVCERTRSAASYRAYHLALDRAVLLRVLPPRHGVSRDACRRAYAIAERVSGLPSAHIGRTLDVGLVAGRFPFLVQEYSKGRSLQALLEERGPLEPQRVITLGRQLSSALETAHAAGVLHGSLRPDSIWLESLSDRPEWLRLFGFGNRELPDGEFEGPESGVYPRAPGNLGVLSAHEQRGLRADIYGFGACLYELASGARPSWTPGDVAAIPDSDLATAPGLGRRAVLRGLARVLERCLFLLPDTNYQSMRQVNIDLGHLEISARAFCPETLISRQPVTAVAAPPRRARGVLVGGPKVIVRAD